MFTIELSYVVLNKYDDRDNLCAHVLVFLSFNTEVDFIPRLDHAFWKDFHRYYFPCYNQSN